MIRHWVLTFVVFTSAGPSMGKPLAPAPPGSRPSCAVKGLTFCEQVEKYPAKLIQSLLRAQPPEFSAFLTVEREVLDEPPEFILNQGMFAEKQSGNEIRNIREKRADKSDICSLPAKSVQPKAATNQRGEWKFIAQDDKSNFFQKTTSRLCSYNKECTQSCTQMYAQVPMISVGAIGVLQEDTFWIPSSCHCFKNKLTDANTQD